jgi:benzoyl-CoA reductase subunit D
MVRRVGVEEKIALIGGMARNVGFVDSLERDLATKVLIPQEPGFVGALGAALVATNP